MNAIAISRSIFLPMVLCVVSVAPMTMSAQNDGTNSPPDVLVVQREFTKPGRGTGAHEKTEAAYVQAVKAGNGTMHYLAMTSLSGPDRALFFSGYSNFGDWETMQKANAKNVSMTAAVDQANIADGDMLSAADASIWRRRADMSMNPGNLVGARYMEIEQFKIKPGHSQEWEQATKLMLAAYKQAVPEASWTMYEQAFGPSGNGYVVLMPLKSLADIDEHFTHRQAIHDAMGSDGLTKLDALMTSCIDEEQTNLFAFSPKMSYVPDAWIKADPGYWDQKAEAMTSKKPDAKPQPQPAE